MKEFMTILMILAGIAAIGLPQSALSQDVCADFGRPVEMGFRYLPSTDIDTNQDPGKAEIVSNIGVDDDGISYVVATDESDAVVALTGGGKRFFAGDVPFAGLFVADDATDSFVSTLYVHFYDDSSGGLLQTISYHTSCSQPIELGDVVGNATLVAYVGEQGPAVASVPLDIKPQSCRNPLSAKSKGLLPVAILGTADRDITQIDAASLRLEGVAPLRSAYEDVATPYEPFMGKQDAFDCNDFGPDGLMDLTLKFDAQEVMAVLGDVEDGDVKVLMLSGNLLPEFGSLAIAGEDVVVVLKKGKR